MAVTRIARRESPSARIWQRNYFERVIRSETEWNRLNLYIEANMTNWNRDGENLMSTPEFE